MAGVNFLEPKAKKLPAQILTRKNINEKNQEKFKVSIGIFSWGDGIPGELEEFEVCFHPSLKDEVGDYRLNSTWVPRCIVVDLEPGKILCFSKFEEAK